MNNKLPFEEELLNNLTDKDLYYDKISATIKNTKNRYLPKDIINVTNPKLQKLIISNLNPQNALELIISKELSPNESLLKEIINSNQEKLTTILENEDYYIGRLDFSHIIFPFIEDLILNNTFHQKIFDLLTNPTITPNLTKRIYQEKEQAINIALENEEHTPDQFLLVNSSLQDKIINSLNQYNILDYVFHPLIINNDEVIDKILTKKEALLITQVIKYNYVTPEKLLEITNKKLQKTLISTISEKNILDFIFNNNLPEDLKKYIIATKSTEITNALKNLLTTENKEQKKILFNYIQGNIPKSLDEQITNILKENNPNFPPNRRDELLTETELIQEITNLMSKDINLSSNPQILTLLKNKFNLNTNQAQELLSILPYYKGDKLTLIKNYNTIEQFLLINTQIDKFYQYALNIDYDYITDILNIISHQEEFKKVKTYLETHLYPHTNTPRILIENFINIIKNYNRYQELCLNLSSASTPLSEEEKNNILYLFNQEITIQENKPKTVLDCLNINNQLKKNIIQKLNNPNNLDILELKDIICQILFNDNFKNLSEKLSIYGNTEEMIKLQFNNRHHENIISKASTMEIYTSLIEEISLCNDKDSLINLCQNIIANFEQVTKIFTTKVNYDKEMQELYSMETEANLTKINDNTSYNSVIDKELTKEYGIETYDFSDKEYTLLAHTVSEKTPNYLDVISGYSLGEVNFISLVPISYRNQVYYGKGAGLILGYDTMPIDNFICSSTINLGSNTSIAKNSSQIKSQYRKQRGILETSDPYFCNAEILCFRENLTPKYIILPNGRKPTPLEISLAKQTNLKFAITQQLEKAITNPIKIPHDITQISEREQDITELKSLKEKLLHNFKLQNTPRKIALIADPHSLFEPTLAVLEDARKQGITEIYSLGDNIGTGPNPSEVLELLDKYNVKSITGNHELYITKGIDTFKEHLDHTNSYQSSSNNSNWTKLQLTNQQINNLKLYPKTREIVLGGQKILLCHSIYGFNSDKLIINPRDYDKIFQGHIHFRQIGKSNIETLRGVGIGYKDQDLNKAYYLILTEQPTGGFTIEEKLVLFDIDNLKSSINISTLNEKDKQKITYWSTPRKEKIK